MQDLEVVDIKPRGYCKGVVRALRVVKSTREQYPDETITVLGKIVHNRFITKALEKYRIETVDIPGKRREELLDYVDKGILILSAHGSSHIVKEKALKKGLKLIDAACSDVLSTHDIIQRELVNRKKIIFIGKNKHPETEAILENFPEVYLVTSVEDIEKLSLPINEQIMITNQTTLSIFEIKDIIEKIVENYVNAEVVDEICGATRVRQEAVIKHSDLDALIVVGDPNSNNTAMLAQIGLDSGIKIVQRIDTIHDIELDLLHKNWKVGVTSGASTPTYLTEMVSEYLKNVELDNPQPFPEIDYSKILG